MKQGAAKKHLLMIVPFFPPSAGGGVHRPLSFVKYLERFGWRATVLSPRPDSYWIDDDTLVAEVPASCAVHRTDSLSGQFVLSRLRPKAPARAQVRSSRRFAFLRRLGAWVLIPDTYVGWYPFAVREGRRLLARQEFDAIYSTSPPETAHLVGRRLHGLSALPWVADFRDPWMNLDLLPTPTPVHRWMHRRHERKVCTTASVAVTSRWHERLLRERYADLKEIRLIPNGYDHEKFEALQCSVPATGKLQILHAGMLTQKRSAVPFLRGLRAFLESHPGARERCRVVFVGPRESENDRYVDALGLSAIVEFRDSVTHAESLKMERRSHILLLLKHVDPAYRGIVPGKLYEYLGARRPILALAPEGEAGDLIRRLGRGEVARQEDEQEIAERIGRMYEKYLRGSLDRDYDLSTIPDCTREGNAGKLADYLDHITANRK
ncbi:MAG: glycosyltransferase [Candidatus Krumholzibacteriia bacterium]